jgi:hypothetical protein
MKILACGLGGGLDIINACLLYSAAKNEKEDVVLGSCQPVPLCKIHNAKNFADCGAAVNDKSKINATGRYIEAKVASILNKEVIFFSRKYKAESCIERLCSAIHAAKKEYKLTQLFFVDGGGDALTLTKDDIGGSADSFDPLKGGDAEVLAALDGIENTYLAVVSAGLDIKEDKFQENVDLLRRRNAYFGRVNLKTGEKDDYALDKILEFQDGFLQKYFNLCERTLVLSEADFKNKQKEKSLTAVVTYHAMKGNYGLQRTYVHWEPKTGEQPGVIVKPEHCWMYFFDASMVHEIKLQSM